MVFWVAIGEALAAMAKAAAASAAVAGKAAATVAPAVGKVAATVAPAAGKAAATVAPALGKVAGTVGPVAGKAASMGSTAIGSVANVAKPAVTGAKSLSVGVQAPTGATSAVPAPEMPSYGSTATTQPYAAQTPHQGGFFNRMMQQTGIRDAKGNLDYSRIGQMMGGQGGGQDGGGGASAPQVDMSGYQQLQQMMAEQRMRELQLGGGSGGGYGAGNPFLARR